MKITDPSHSGKKVLAGIPYFSGLVSMCSSTFEKLAEGAILRRIDPGQVIFLEGDPCTGLYVLEEGWVKSVKIAISGREQVVRIVGPGEVFNEIGVLIDSSLNQVTAVALEPARIWVIRRELLLSLMDECPHLARIITQHLAERVQHLMGLVEDLSLRSVKGRLIRALLEGTRGDKLHRRRWATQAEMANRLGTVPDVISRVLRSLEEEGLIQVERSEIHILDRQALEELIETG